MITTQDATRFLKWVQRSGGVVVNQITLDGGGTYHIWLGKGTPKKTPMGYAHPEKAHREAGLAFLALGRFLAGIRKWPKAAK